MTFTVRIDTDNAAFGDHRDNEVARILRETADRLEDLRDTDIFTLSDCNGNVVGTAGFKVGR